MSELETVLKVLGAKIQSLETELRFKDYEIEKLKKELEEAHHE